MAVTAICSQQCKKWLSTKMFLFYRERELYCLPSQPFITIMGNVAWTKDVLNVLGKKAQADFSRLTILSPPIGSHFHPPQHTLVYSLSIKRAIFCATSGFCMWYPCMLGWRISFCNNNVGKVPVIQHNTLVHCPQSNGSTIAQNSTHCEIWMHSYRKRQRDIHFSILNTH